ncbi:MAG: DegT/DnrJ/EryC1/StrS family aminotransferase [Myxococcota bacterium]|nr:DegT/DnrJ/EryC1/StrS family aminotransferase [Myxococcota bacterium]
MLQVFEPEIGEEEIELVVDALRKGEISGSFGSYLPRFEEGFAKFCGARHGIAVTSGTTALELAVAAAGIGAGDEVLISSCTNIATALAVYRNNAISVPVDSEPTTWNLDLDLIESLITPRTKAILPVHIYGHPVDMDRLNAIAKRHGLLVIEDAAEAHGAEVRGKRVGALSDMGCFSFYANKILTTGEGGMVVTNDDALAKQLRLLRNLGFTQPRFFHEVPGYNFRMTGMQAAFGLAQLGRIDRVIEQRRRVAHLYNAHLADIAELQLPPELPWAKNVYWMYSVVFRPRAGQRRDELLDFLRANEVDTRTMFCPMNMQPFLKAQQGHRDISCPVAENLWANGFYLPSSATVTEADVVRIAALVKQYLAR